MALSLFLLVLFTATTQCTQTIHRYEGAKLNPYSLADKPSDFAEPALNDPSIPEMLETRGDVSAESKTTKIHEPAVLEEAANPEPKLIKEKSKPFDACYRWSSLTDSSKAIPSLSSPSSPPTPDIPTPRDSLTAWIDPSHHYLFLLGGCGQSSLENPNNCFSQLYRFDLSTHTYETQGLEGVPNTNEGNNLIKMHGHAYTVDPSTGTIFIFGGSRVVMHPSSQTAANSVLSNSLTILTPINCQSKSRPDLCHYNWMEHQVINQNSKDAPPPCEDAALAWDDGLLVLFGGYSDLGFFDDVYVLDTTAAVWEWIPANVVGSFIPPGLKGHTLTRTKPGEFYLFGGSDGNKTANDMYVLTHDDKSDEWSWNQIKGDSTSIHSVASPRAYHTISLVNNLLYIFGGCDFLESECFNDVHIFDIDQAKWLTPSQAGTLLMSGDSQDGDVFRPKARGHHSTVAIVPSTSSEDEEVYPHLLTFGGCSFDECYNDVVMLDLEAVCGADDCGDHGEYSSATQSCRCYGDYSGKFCQKHAVCPNNCTEHGTCKVDDEFHYCACEDGYWGVDCSSTSCPNHCSGAGLCEAPTPKKNADNDDEVPSKCNCRPGWEGEDCSQSTVPNMLLLSCANNCSGNGLCQISALGGSPVCTCRDGYGGKNKEGKIDCSVQCPMLCSGSDHGKCQDDGTCKCLEGWSGIACSQAFCYQNCSNHGDCIADICQCHDGYTGAYCQTDLTCSGHGHIDAKTKQCVCDTSYVGASCQHKLICPISCVHGVCDMPLSSTPTAKSPTLPLPPPGTAKNLIELLLEEETGGLEVPEPIVDTVEGICRCDAGFTGDDCSKPMCPQDCSGHGLCVSVGECKCYPGYKLSDCSLEVGCPKNCSSHGACQQDGSCFCDDSFTGPDCSQLRCPNDCFHRGDCKEGKCLCAEGFFGNDCSGECENHCSQHGRCVEGACICLPEFTGKDCSQVKKCPKNPANQLECSGPGRGICYRPDQKCICKPGYEGDDCSQGSGGCPHDCYGHGICSEGICFCDIGYDPPHCANASVCGVKSLPDVPTANSVIPDTECSGHGFCHRGTCLCFLGFTGPNCDQVVNDMTKCMNNCSNNGQCQFGKCWCLDGYAGDDCSTVVGFCAGNDCSGQGECRFGKCHCFPGASGERCEISGCTMECPADKGVCLRGKCRCLPGYTGVDCKEATICAGGPGLGSCSSRGVCVLGVCQCFPGYDGPDCSIATLAVEKTCPNNCSNAGDCQFGRCMCIDGLTGPDCSIGYALDCPWDCSGRGVCNRGKCYCDPGFEGTACQSEKKCNPKCVEHGICHYGKCFCVAGYSGDDCQAVLVDDLKEELLTNDIIIANRALGVNKDCAILRYCSNHGACIVQEGDAKCACETGWIGQDCSIVVAGPLSRRCGGGGNCNSHGECLFGKCICHLGWSGSLCDSEVMFACPNDCSGQGLCHYGRCSCDDDYSGADCSQRVKSVFLEEEPVKVEKVVIDEPRFVDVTHTVKHHESTLAATTTQHTQQQQELICSKSHDIPLILIVGILCFAGGVFGSHLSRYMAEKRQQARTRAMLQPLVAARA